MLTRKMIIGMAFVLLVTMCQSLWAVQYYVDKNGDNTTGLSWATAFHTIQQGIDASNATIVDVNKDTYYENIDFKDEGVTVQSVDYDDWSVVASTIIDGNDSDNVVNFDSYDSGMLRGFTITGAGDHGIYCDHCWPTIAYCLIRDNDTDRDGAGMLVDNGADDDGDQIYDPCSAASVRYCDVEGGWPGTGNIDCDPDFCDATDLDGTDNVCGTCDDGLELRSGSCCIDAADQCAGGGVDLCGKNCELDGDGDSSADPDMGCYEYDPNDNCG